MSGAGLRLSSDWYDFVAPLYEAARQHPVVSHDGTPACTSDGSLMCSQLETVSEPGRFLGVSSQPGPAAVRDGRAEFFAFFDAGEER